MHGRLKINNKINLTTHERHARLVKIVRKTWQAEHDVARLFVNTSGVAWQGNAVSGAGKVELLNPRPVFFGIPAPDGKGCGEESGGADLIGETPVLCYRCCEGMTAIQLPIFTAIEIKTGASRLKKNQRVFRDWVKSINGIYYVARECPECCDNWTPVMAGGKVVEWKIDSCPCCSGKGYILEE